MAIDCDVLVVGTGPAGCAAARAAAMGGAKTIVVEKKKEVGEKIECAEGISKYLMPLMPYELPKRLLVWQLKGIKLTCNNLSITQRGDMWEGYHINKPELERWLLDGAIKSGAKLFSHAKLISLNIEGKIVKEAVIISGGKESVIKPKIVIAADGIRSVVSEELGINVFKESDIGKAHAFEMSNLNLDNPELDQIYFGDFAPGSYAYIFPKSRTSANVGIATTKNKKNVEECFQKFINSPDVKKQLKDGQHVRETGGEAPVADHDKKLVYGNVMFVGDIASQAFQPFVEGNLPSIICGEICGRVSSLGVHNLGVLNQYPIEVQSKLGDIYALSSQFYRGIRKIPLSQRNNKASFLHLMLFSGLFEVEEVLSLKNRDLNVIKKRILEIKKLEKV